MGLGFNKYAKKNRFRDGESNPDLHGDSVKYSTIILSRTVRTIIMDVRNEVIHAMRRARSDIRKHT